MSGRHTCSACGKEIIGQSLCVKGEHFHKECFTCGKCNKPLTGQFKTQDGVRICMGCSPAQYCEVCKKAGSGTMLKLNGKVYHTECFKCADCGVSLQNGVCCKGDKMLCNKCASSGGKVKVLNTCSKCKQEKEADSSSGAVVDGSWFCRDCFVCAKCACQLTTEAFVHDKSLKETGEYACLCKACGAPPEQSVTEAPCIVCKQLCTTDSIQLSDGLVVHAACTKCSACGGTQDAGQAGHLSGKIKPLKLGKYTCSKCDQASQSELGTYGGKAKIGRDEISYCICLRKNFVFWLDKTTTNPISTSSFHSEGKYTRTIKEDGTILFTMTVDYCPIGGTCSGPKSGTVYLAELAPGGRELACEGIRCPKSGMTDADLEKDLTASGGVSPFDPKELPKAKSPSAKQEAVAATPPPTKQPAKAPPAPAVPAVPGAVEEPAVEQKAAAPRAVKAPAVEQKAPSPAVATAPAEQSAPTPGKCFTPEQLRNADFCKEQGVDPAAKEACLSDADFAEVFGISREKFLLLPKWKRDKQKKEVGFF